MRPHEQLQQDYNDLDNHRALTGPVLFLAAAVTIYAAVDQGLVAWLLAFIVMAVAATFIIRGAILRSEVGFLEAQAGSEEDSRDFR
jgi:hypothetical protein